MDDPDDAAIAEFHAAARRRNVRIFAVTSLVCLLIGIAILVVTFSADPPEASSSTRRFEARTILFGLGFIVAGGASAVTAYKVARGKTT